MDPPCSSMVSATSPRRGERGSVGYLGSDEDLLGENLALVRLEGNCELDLLGLVGIASLPKSPTFSLFVMLLVTEDAIALGSSGLSQSELSLDICPKFITLFPSLWGVARPSTRIGSFTAPLLVRLV